MSGARVSDKHHAHALVHDVTYRQTRYEKNWLPHPARSIHPVTLLEDLAHVAVGVLLGFALYSLSSGLRTTYHRSKRSPTISIQLRPFSDTSYME